MECSAKEGHNIQEIFRCFVTLARIMPPAAAEETPLKRRYLIIVYSLEDQCNHKSFVSLFTTSLLWEYMLG